MSSASGASDAPPPDPCCICMSLDDYQGTLLVQCARCSIRVHVKCYGVSIEGINASSWLCQACEYVASAPSPRPTPQCAVCPISGGALRLTDQRDVWCHVLCINWIPELYHSLTGVMDEAVQISQYDKSRSMLRCVVCGVRGGCIQCVSGRCAKAFHVVCAFRSPSSLVFTGYNTQNQQVYHCKTHLSDVDTTKFEMVDNSWRALPEVKRYEEEHPSTNEPKCRFCGNKVTLPNKEVHETQCLLGWMARADVRKRKQELDRLGVKPVEIVYKDNEKSPAKKGKRNRSSPNARKNSREANGKFKRQETLMRPCPECGEHVRETLMMGHMRNSCPKSKHAMKRKMSPRNGIPEDVEVADMTDVLFASWPGQNSGAPMDSTYFWKVVENHFYNSSVLEKKRMGQLSKSLCGVKLEDIAKALRRRLQASDIHCRDTMRLERHAEDPTQSLVLQKCTHKCDFLMRASHCRCLSDPLAKPMIEIRHNPQCTKPIANQAAGSGPIHVPDGTEANMRVQFKTGENSTVDCKYSLRVSRDENSMNQHAADNGTFASTFQHDAVSTLAGFDMQTKKVPLAQDDKLLISLDSCDQVENAPLVKAHESHSQVFSILSAPTDTPLADEFTPAINLLMEHLKDTTEQNRFRIRTLYKNLKSKEADESKFQLEAQVTDMYYREFVSWKRLCSSLLIGYKSGDQPEEEDDKKTTESEQDGSTEDEDDAVDDGTCVVCFDGQSPETNPIIFCDRCELAVHQRCYGMAKVPSNEFICDRCRATREGLDPARDVFCQLCSLSDGAFKRTVDGKWVHVVCALWCPKVWIGNLFDLSEISLVGTSSQVRFLNSVEEIKARIAQASSSQHLTPKSGDHLEVPGIELGSLCVHCRVACGRTIQCCHPGCSTSFHPLCGWYDGLPMTVALGDERYMYAGGGAGLNFQMFCSKHLPEYYPASEQLAQRRRRARFRIDSYFVMRNKDNYSSGVKKQADDESSLLSGSIVQAVLSAESKLSAPETDADVTDWTDMTVCSACFEYCAPLVGELTDVNMLHRRQFMIRCQYCNVYIHPECCISDIGSSATIFRSNWICERCTQTGGNGTPECVVCAKATDYLMPCIDPPVPVNQANGKAVFDAKAAITAIRPAPGGGQQLWLLAHHNMQRQMQGQTNSGNKIPSQLKGPESNGVASHPTPNRWIHVYCSKWQKAKTVKKQHMLCAYTPTLKSDGLATRCELCDKKEGMLASCAQCNRRFHPICAAQKKLYCARSNRTDWKFYCEAHPPADAAFDANRQSWITQEILGQLQDLRRSLERGRMLLEMSRQRDRQHKRLLNLCKLPLMETSIDVILKKRPTPYMKEVYKEITGETLIDVPHRAKVAPPPSRNSRNRVRNSPRAASGGRSTRAAKRSASQAAVTPERSPKRRRTRTDSDASNNGDDNPRRSSRRKSLRFNQEDSENEEEEGQEDEVEAQKKVWANLAVPKEIDDFDFVVAEQYPGLVD
ncbi:hypothetical protein PC129_g11900 [Phytophthora cactorum]|uniref:Uncharacterized protein n=1 Tax=Phytophthora cactorum TaxID=29920 RepID=A0A8T1HWF2_9STRA|nr:hypothetical protein PC129_g11900 [Phytophthora cactorum]